MLEVTEEEMVLSTSIARATAAAAAEWLERPPRRSGGGAAGVQCSAMSSPRCPEVGAGVGRCRFFALRCIVTIGGGIFLPCHDVAMLRNFLILLVP